MRLAWACRRTLVDSSRSSRCVGFPPSVAADANACNVQLDRLLSSTVDAAGAPYSSSTDVQLGDSATFDYNEFLTAFGSEGPASYDPTVQTFDLAV